MTGIVAVTSLGVFILALWILRVVPVSARAIFVAQGAVAIIRDHRYDDAAREKAVQHASLKLLKVFFSLLSRGSLTLLASLAPIFLADISGLVASENVIVFLSRIDVIIIATIAITTGYFVVKRLWPTK